jgi:hypothetical protein
LLVLFTDIDLIISQLAAPLEPRDRPAFRAAAEDAVRHVAHPGPGSIWRAVAALQRNFFDPPVDGRVDSGPRHYGSKLADGPAIGADDVRTGGRARNELKAAG